MIKFTKGEIPEGAQRMHFMHPIQTMAPRGSLKKNSLGEYILDKLVSNFESYTDPTYSDVFDHQELAGMLVSAVKAEVNAAIKAFIEEVDGK